MTPSPSQIEKAMDEWLTTKGLEAPEVILIQELKKFASLGWDAFYSQAQFYLQFATPSVAGAVNKAREQGKCQCWPD